ncbi:hypothetical protein DUE52_11195 [Larkinella punicea]|uniref:Uncharacterized protein n=2 Tax=Larkinella punicea TaxID=2315727 RepID=A0A368JP17_9BACT|nr:hypothetical protein DUE52_11195 [Larkinella punicea]
MPFLKKYFGEILFRIAKPASPFFRPLITAGVYLAVLSAFLVGAKDQLFPALGWTVPVWLILSIEIVGFASGAIATVASLTLDESGLKELNEQKANGLV